VVATAADSARPALKTPIVDIYPTENTHQSDSNIFIDRAIIPPTDVPVATSFESQIPAPAIAPNMTNDINI
jgi:hypothetical protein